MTTGVDYPGRVQAYLIESAEVTRKVSETCVGSIIAGADLITDTFKSGGKLLLCGNGGSAADCQHMATELTSRLSKEFERPGLPAIALTTDTSFLTAYSNDYEFQGVFERQVYALGRAGDALIGISTSGNSDNVCRAMEAAKKANMRSIALTGSGGRLGKLADIAIQVPCSDTQYIQEAHLAIEHILCYLVERGVFGDGYTARGEDQ